MSTTILIVDDEPDVEPLFRQRFRRELRAGSLELLFAHSGDEALDVLRQPTASEIALVLSDINMPGMTGLELLRRIKAMPPPVPVCMMTAYGSEDFRRSARAGGSDGYLTKPVDFDALKERIGTLRSP
jgi:CheY-like chemotaxis protein